MPVVRNTALAASASFLWVLPGPAVFAQGPSPQAANDSSALEEVTVTGFRLKYSFGGGNGRPAS